MDSIGAQYAGEVSQSLPAHLQRDLEKIKFSLFATSQSLAASLKHDLDKVNLELEKQLKDFALSVERHVQQSTSLKAGPNLSVARQISQGNVELHDLSTTAWISSLEERSGIKLKQYENRLMQFATNTRELRIRYGTDIRSLFLDIHCQSEVHKTALAVGMAELLKDEHMSNWAEFRSSPLPTGPEENNSSAMAAMAPSSETWNVPLQVEAKEKDANAAKEDPGSSEANPVNDADDIQPETSKVFDPEAMKQKVKDSRSKFAKKYNVFDYYHETGCIQKIAKSPIFDNTTLIFIAVNAVWMGYDTDENKAETLMSANMQFIVGENVFCAYFFGEWLIRFFAFKKKRSGLRDGWFMFDTCLVFLMVMETWIFVLLNGGENPFGDNAAILRLFRLLRLTRLIKMLKSFPQLLILVKGMITAMKSVIYVIVLLVGITYIFAIACTQLSVDTEGIRTAYFEGVGLSIYSLIIHATFLDALSDFMNDIRAENTLVLFVVSTYVFLSALTIMNMLIGILCEVVAAVAATEKEDILVDQITYEMKTILDELDEDGNGMISITEMNAILEMPEGVQALDNVGVDSGSLLDFAEMFFFDENMNPIEVSFPQFMELLLNMRASNTATLKDIMNLGKQNNGRMKGMLKAIGAIDARIQGIEGTLMKGSKNNLGDGQKAFQNQHGRQIEQLVEDCL